ncbi:hypothetical protein Tco_1375103 [Tanacetum coccineum]
MKVSFGAGHLGIIAKGTKSRFGVWFAKPSIGLHDNNSTGSKVSKGEDKLKANADFTEYEAEALEALKSKLKGIIEKGVTFGNKQVVSA